MTWVLLPLSLVGVLIWWYRTRRGDLIPSDSRAQGRYCPVCGAVPGQLCHRNGITLVIQMHRGRLP